MRVEGSLIKRKEFHPLTNLKRFDKALLELRSPILLAKHKIVQATSQVESYNQYTKDIVSKTNLQFQFSTFLPQPTTIICSIPTPPPLLIKKESKGELLWDAQFKVRETTINGPL